MPITALAQDRKKLLIHTYLPLDMNRNVGSGGTPSKPGLPHRKQPGLVTRLQGCYVPYKTGPDQ